MTELLGTQPKSEKGDAFADKTLISSINRGANALPLQLKFEFEFAVVF